MTENRMQPSKKDDRPEPAKPAQVGQRAQQTQTNAATQPGERPALGRRPLFRS